MNAYEYILSKQIQWAYNKNISLIGSKGKRGRPAYVPELSQNLFEPLAPDVRKCFEKGDGNEINGSPGSPAKMQAVHSSSALSVNIFQYWNTIGKGSEIAAACGFCRKDSFEIENLVFEDKYPISDNHQKFPIAPNIDVVLHIANSSTYQRFAVECKFSEAYGNQRHGGLKPAYMELQKLWADIPHLFEYAKTISPEENFEYLHSAQLIKHILGLKNHFGKQGFRLLYLWYDVLGKEGALHRKEIETFREIVKQDGVRFHDMSYQELIIKIAKNYREEHNNYIQYLTERYI